MVSHIQSPLILIVVDRSHLVNIAAGGMLYRGGGENTVPHFRTPVHADEDKYWARQTPFQGLRRLTTASSRVCGLMRPPATWMAAVHSDYAERDDTKGFGG